MKIKAKTIVVLSAPLLACLSNSTLAQQSNDSFEEIVVIANRIPVPLRQVASSVTILEQEDLQAHGNLSVIDVLRQTTAVATSSNGGIGSVASLRIRGEEGFRTLTLFDGLELSDPSAPQVFTPLEHLLSTGIGRIEVLRGPQGLGYGADAGGVIAISSIPQKSGLNVELDAQGGARGTQQLATNLSAANEDMDFFLSAADFQTDGYNTRLSDSVLSDRDGYQNQTIHSRIGFDFADSWRLQLVHRDVSGETQYDGCFAGTTVHDCLARYDLQASRLSLSYTTEALRQSFAYSTTQSDRDDLALGVSAFGSEGEITKWEYMGSTTLLPASQLVFGADRDTEKSASGERDNTGVYIEYMSDFSEQLFLNAGIRHDDNDDFGTHTSYRLSSAYIIDLQDSSLKFKASYGSGFRAPSLFEIEYNNGPFAFPPAAGVTLNAETSEGVEAGVEYSVPGRLVFEAILFQQQVEDAIIFDLAGFSGYLQDSGSSESTGIELRGDFSITRQLSLNANVTYNDTERPDGSQRLRRPKWLGNLGLRYSSLDGRIKFGGFLRSSRDAVDEQFGSPIALEDFQVVDLSASYLLSDGIEVYGRIENALDERYQEIVDFVAPGRASYIGVRFNL